MKRFKRAFIGFFIVFGMLVSAQNDVLAASATVDTSEVHQTMEGFGASVAWEIYQLYSHSKKSEVYNYLFKELGLDILRLRNIYGRGEDYAFPMLGVIVDSFYAYSENEPAVLISSWSPPASLKSNGQLTNGGTLDSTSTGEFLYGEFARYWMDALEAFGAVGIVPDYISIQNEPSYTASWASCRFAPTETDTLAGYDQALDSVYNRLQGLASPPKFLAAEAHGIGYGTFQSFANEFNHDEYIYGHAYHLYHGGDGNVNPDAFNGNLSAIANSYSDKPIFQTEYDYGGWFNTGWLMHNCLVYGNVSGYFYWSSVWSSGGNPLITLDGSTYTINQVYWVFRQYSKAIHSGWKRVGASVDEDSVRISAYISPDKYDLSVIVINVGHSDETLDLDFSDFYMIGANMLRTSEEEKCDLVGYYDGSTLNLPARSITTISTLYIEDVSGIEEDNDDSPNTFNCSLSQNYPNPFNSTTTIEYSVAREGFVKLAIYDILGREIRTLVEKIMPAGKHTVNVEVNGLAPGIYFYKLTSEGNSIQKKMILLK
jgi:glucuronoarabinoxylan endo-1,4-beta-xylanase